MDDGEGTDFHAVRQGQIALTPLKVDLTDHAGLDHWAQAAKLLPTGPDRPLA